MAPPSIPDTALAGPAPALRAALAEPLHRPLAARQWVALALGAVAVLGFPWVFGGPYWMHMAIILLLNALMAQSWNILAGYCGQISLGHAVFFGIGAYASGYLFATYGISPWLGMGVGVVLAMAVAAGIGIPTLRLRGHYFAIATLVIGESAQIIVLRWEALGAASGIWLPIVRDTPWLDFQFNTTKVPYYYIVLGMLVACSAAVWHLDRSRMGYYFRAIREDAEAASSLGVDVSRYKVQAFMLSAAFMAMAGTFNTQYVLLIDPEADLSILRSILVVLVAVVGGVGTVWGPIVGAALLVPMSEATRVYFGGTGGTVDLMIYGALIVLVCIFRPEGIVGLARHWVRPTVQEQAPGPEEERNG